MTRGSRRSSALRPPELAFITEPRTRGTDAGVGVGWSAGGRRGGYFFSAAFL